MHTLLSHTLAPSTNRSYNHAYNKYTKFCQIHNLQALPLHETNIMLYTTHISNTSISNINIHISAIKHFAAYLTGQHSFNFPRLYMPIRSIKRNKKPNGKQKRLPITLPLLEQIHTFLTNSHMTLHDVGSYHHCLLWVPQVF